MCNEAAFRINCVGIAGFSDLDPQDSRQQEFEINFGHCDPGFLGPDCHRHGHVQRPVSKENGAAIRSPGFNVQKQFLGRPIPAATGDIGAVPCDPQILLPGRINQRDLMNRRCVFQ